MFWWFCARFTELSKLSKRLKLNGKWLELFVLSFISILVIEVLSCMYWKLPPDLLPAQWGCRNVLLRIFTILKGRKSIMLGWNILSKTLVHAVDDKQAVVCSPARDRSHSAAPAALHNIRYSCNRPFQTIKLRTLTASTWQICEPPVSTNPLLKLLLGWLSGCSGCAAGIERL